MIRIGRSVDMISYIHTTYRVQPAVTMIFRAMSQKLLREYLSLMVEKVRSKRKVKTRFGGPQFDIEEFKRLPSSAIQQAYAMNYLEPLGQGSSRIAFVLSSRKVLKIAKNSAGLAQNNAEVEVYTDPATREMAAKIYDADVSGQWTISELVRPITSIDEFESLTGVVWQQFKEDLANTISAKARAGGTVKLPSSAGEFTKKVFRMAEKGSNKLKLGDLTEIDHWGKTADGKVVILDYGFTVDVDKKFYAAKKDQAAAIEDTPTNR